GLRSASGGVNELVDAVVARFCSLASTRRCARILVDEAQPLALPPKSGPPRWRGQRPRRRLPIAVARTPAAQIQPFAVGVRACEMTRTATTADPGGEKRGDSLALKIAMPREGYPFSLSRHNVVVPRVPLPVGPRCSCALRALELVRCCISRGLGAFLAAHAGRLRTLVLRECFAQSGGPSFHDVSWADFFDGMRGTLALTDLRVVNEDVCLCLDDVYRHCDVDATPDSAGFGSPPPAPTPANPWPEHDAAELAAAAARIRRELADPASSRRAFAYVVLGSCYLDSMPDYRATVRAYDEGRDQSTQLAQVTPATSFKMVSARYILVGALALVAPSMAAPVVERDGCTKSVTINPGDTCIAIANANGISLSDLLAWNSNINSGCTNLVAGAQICVGASSGEATPTSKGGDSAPTPKGCKTTVKVNAGDSCWGIANARGLTLEQLNALNPWINSGCTNLIAGGDICVAGN
ncbi:hypothetical protein KEM52_003887, partial [Ascosphaera acerosa]